MSLTIKHRVSLDLSPTSLTSVQATIPFRKGDKGAHEVIFSLRNGTTNVELPPGTVATIAVLNGADDGKGVNDMCTVDHINHRIIYIPTVAALSVAGNVACELTVVGTNGEVLGAPRIHFFVDESMTDVTEEEIAEALKASSSWDVIQQTAMNAEDAAQSKDDAQKWADGTGAEDGDDQYQNNAKYYTELAGDSAKDAAAYASNAESEKKAAVQAKEAAESAKNGAITAFNNANGSANEASRYANSAQKWANGDGTEDGNEQYQNNAKYYSNLSHRYAGEASDYADQVGKGAKRLEASIDPLTYELTLRLISAVESQLSEVKIDLPLESMITKIEYDDATKELIFTLENGTTTRVPLDDTVSGLATNTELEAGLAGKVDKLTTARKLYGTNSAGKQTIYSIADDIGDDTENPTLTILTQAAVTATMNALSARIETNKKNITKNTEDIASNAERISELEKGGGGSGLNNLYDAEIAVGEIINGKMVVSTGAIVVDSASCATDFIAVGSGYTLHIAGCSLQYSRSICAYNEDKTFVECVATMTTATEVTYSVPSGVRYIRVTGVTGIAPKITKVNYPINAELKYLENMQDETLEPIKDNLSGLGIVNLPVGELTPNSYILASTGGVASVSDSSVTDFIALKPWARVKIKNAFLVGNRGICGYDVNKNRVMTIVENTTNTEHIIESVPPAVKYIRITCRLDESPSVVQVSTLTGDDVYINDITIEGAFEPGYLGTDGKTVLTHASYMISPFIAVHPHQEIEIRKFISAAGYLFHCYDANKNIVESFEGQGYMDRAVFDLPFNAHFIRVHAQTGSEGAVTVSYTKRIRYNASTIELVDEWYSNAHNKIDRLFKMATKKPLITFIDDDTLSVAGVKRFRDICMELGIRGTYACLTAILDRNTTGELKSTLLEYQKEGFHIAMHAHDAHDLYAAVGIDIAKGNPIAEETLKTLERDFVICIEKLKSFGFIDTAFWITPGGSTGYVNDDLMRKWGINCYVTCGNDQLEYEGTNPKRGRYGLVRPSIGPDDTRGSQTVAQVKTIIDNASVDNGWVLVCTHMGDSGWDTEAALDRFRELVNYARSKGFEVRTLNDAWRIREPIYKLYEMF